VFTGDFGLHVFSSDLSRRVAGKFGGVLLLFAVGNNISGATTAIIGSRKTSSLVDDIGEAFVVSVGEIPLERGGLNGIDRQDAQQYRMTRKRFLVRSQNAASGFGDCLCSFRSSSCRLLEPAFGRAQTLRCGFSFARTSPGWCTLDHGRDSSLSPASVYALPLVKGFSWQSRGHRFASGEERSFSVTFVPLHF